MKEEIDKQKGHPGLLISSLWAPVVNPEGVFFPLFWTQIRRQRCFFMLQVLNKQQWTENAESGILKLWA